MTKARDPLSFGNALTLIVKLIGAQLAAQAAGRARRTVEHWNDSTVSGLPSLERALALDLAYLRAGGGHAPILECYLRQLELALAEAVPCQAAHAGNVAQFSMEAGEAVSHLVLALQPDATPAQITRAISEIEQADAIIPRLLRHLKALLPGNGAALEDLGVLR